jgi:Rrf2 family protein
MFSSTSEYALRAVVELAKDAAPRTASALADAVQIPKGYVSKVMQDLARAGIVNSQRGPNGGFTLARPADKISVLDVLNAVDPLRRILACPLNLPEHAQRLCKLHQKLDDAIALVEKTLEAARISDMVETTQPPPCQPGPAGAALTVGGKRRPRA